MNGWDFRQMAFLYGLWMLGHAFHNTFFFTVGDVPTFVREGRFDRFLVRPLDTLFQALTVPQQIWPDELLLAIIFFSFATHFAGVHVNARLRLLRSAGHGRRRADRLRHQRSTIATASFWFIRIDTLRWVVMSLEQDFTRYPISIYTRGVRFVLTFILPFAFMNYFPATFLLHKTQTGLALSPASRAAHAARRGGVRRGGLRVLARRPQSLPGDRQLGK